VASLISEGFEQSTDRHFAQYCYRSKGSSRETRTQLVVAVQRRHISEAEQARICNMFEEIAKMLTGLIRHLETEDRKHRR
jgi:four helix bundle protein